jgi:hypothetical protein
LLRGNYSNASLSCFEVAIEMITLVYKPVLTSSVQENCQAILVQENKSNKEKAIIRLYYIYLTTAGGFFWSIIVAHVSSHEKITDSNATTYTQEQADIICHNN